MAHMLTRKQTNRRARAKLPLCAAANRAFMQEGPMQENLPVLRVALGIDAIDAALDPTGYARRNLNCDTPRNPNYKTSEEPHAYGIHANALHEVRVEAGLAAASAAGFALILGRHLARGLAMAEPRPGKMQSLDCVSQPLTVFWIADPYARVEYGEFYGPGLAGFGLGPENLIRIAPPSRRDALWAAGEIAATPGLAGFCLMEICGNPAEMDLTATRRLMLRAMRSKTPVIILRQGGGEEASAAATRWLAAPSQSPPRPHLQSSPRPHLQSSAILSGRDPLAATLIGGFAASPRFAVTLEKCRGGKADPETCQWTLEWNPHEQRLAAVSPASASPSAQSPAPQSSVPQSSIQCRNGAALFDATGHLRSRETGTALSFIASAEIADRPDRKGAQGQ